MATRFAVNNCKSGDTKHKNAHRNAALCAVRSICGTRNSSRSLDNSPCPPSLPSQCPRLLPPAPGANPLAGVGGRGGRGEGGGWRGGSLRTEDANGSEQSYAPCLPPARCLLLIGRWRRPMASASALVRCTRLVHPCQAMEFSGFAMAPRLVQFFYLVFFFFLRGAAF